MQYSKTLYKNNMSQDGKSVLSLNRGNLKLVCYIVCSCLGIQFNQITYLKNKVIYPLNKRILKICLF